MPAAIGSSVKHPDGIYLTAGQWTRIEISPCFGSSSLVFALLLLVFSLQSTPVAPSFNLSNLPHKVLSTPLPLFLICCVAGEGLKLFMCLINEDPVFCYRKGLSVG